MKKLSPQERLDIYEDALEDWRSFSKETSIGLCFYFLKTKGLTPDLDNDLDVIEFYFPELHNQKPQSENFSELWFEIGTPHGSHLRRMCLIKAIKEVKLLINKNHE